MVRDMLKDAEKSIESPKLLISPHAGYVFSGKAAAIGYKQLEEEDVSCAIILGSAHRYPLSSPSVYLGTAYRTPLGIVSIDREKAEEIAKIADIGFTEEAHSAEHSIEVQIPFLQVLFPEIKIVTILIGRTDEDKLERLAEAIAKTADRETVIIASTDLSHFPEYATATKVDKETIAIIESLDEKGLIEREMSAYKTPDVDTYICGLGPVVVAIKLAKRLGLSPKVLTYYNSGDTPYGDRYRVVGYTSIAFYKESLSREEKERLLNIARSAIETYLKEGNIIQPKETSTTLTRPSGVFVTLNKHHHLRGCIGYIFPVKPLYQAVVDNAISAAVRDYRFPPVTIGELSDIEIEISVLTPPEKVNSWKDIVIGRDGIVLQVGRNQAVFLPQVAPEQGWELEETLEHLSLKAGLNRDAYKREDAVFSVFQAEVFSEKD
jgi:hypothetical protein